MKMSSQSLSPKMQKLFIEKVQKKKKNQLKQVPFSAKADIQRCKQTDRLWTHLLARAIHSRDSKPLSLCKVGLLCEAKANKLEKQKQIQERKSNFEFLIRFFTKCTCHTHFVFQAQREETQRILNVRFSFKILKIALEM